MKFIRIFSIFVICLSISVNVSAFGLKDVVGGGKGGGVDVDNLMNDQSELLKQVSAALLNLATSQALMAEALGLKEQAAIAAQNADALESGDLTGKDDMEKQINSSQEVSNAIHEKLNESEGLSAEGKATFAKSLPPYGLGSVGVVTTSKKAIEQAKGVSSTKDLTILSKLGPLLSYSKKAPGLIQSFTASTGSIIKFSKANGIDTTDLEKATSDW
jgi:hypothetical protein